MTPTRAATCPPWCTEDHTYELAQQLDGQLGGFDGTADTLWHVAHFGPELPMDWNGIPEVEVRQDEQRGVWGERRLYVAADCPVTPAQARLMAAALLTAAAFAEGVGART